MRLSELLEKVNQELKDNMNKEIIKNGRNYDYENGRKSIGEYTLKDIIAENSDNIIENWNIQINGGVNLNFFGIKFKLKRVRSGIVSFYGGTNQLIYSEITVIKDFEDKLDYNIEKIKEEYQIAFDKKIEDNRQKEQRNANNLKEKIDKLGIDVFEFEKLANEFNNLNWREKDILFGIEQK